MERDDEIHCLLPENHHLRPSQSRTKTVDRPWIGYSACVLSCGIRTGIVCRPIGIATGLVHHFEVVKLIAFTSVKSCAKRIELIILNTGCVVVSQHVKVKYFILEAGVRRVQTHELLLQIRRVKARLAYDDWTCIEAIDDEFFRFRGSSIAIKSVPGIGPIQGRYQSLVAQK